jgi:hypothetical protein
MRGQGILKFAQSKRDFIGEVGWKLTSFSTTIRQIWKKSEDKRVGGEERESCIPEKDIYTSKQNFFSFFEFSTAKKVRK